MTTRNKLPGIELLGYSYDVQGYYADARSVITRQRIFNFDYDSYDPNQDPAPGRVNVFNEDYYYPTSMHVSVINRSALTTQNTMSLSDFAVSVRVSGEVHGWYEGFSGSVQASFGANYRTNSAFYSIVQMGMIEGYQASLSNLSDLKNQLTDAADADINGSMSADDVIAKYGTHFVFNGTFGGTLNYSQSISRYSVSTEADAEAKVTANYLGFIGGSISGSVEVDHNQTDEQSSAVFEAKGGDPAHLTAGYESWATTVTSGEFALMNFDKDSLQPLSLLARDPQRASQLDAAIVRALQSTPPEIQTLSWDSSNNHKTNYGSSDDGPELHIDLSNQQTNRVIVGLAVGVKDGDVNRMAIRTLDLDDNSLAWITHDGSSFNAGNYEVTCDIPADTGKRGVAMTGVELSCHSDNCVAIRAWYQSLDPADGNSRPTFLADSLASDFQGDSDYADKSTLEVHFEPDPDAGKIITGVGLRVHNDDFTVLELAQAPLLRANVPASSLEAAE